MGRRQLGTKAVRPTDLLSLQDSIITGAIAGLTTANDNTTPATVLDVAVGLCADSTGQYLMRLNSAWTKSIASNWAIGSGAGGLDTGAATASTWYHVHLIYNPTTAVSDVLFSLSPTAPTLPSGYTAFRRIGSIYYSSNPSIKLFTQNGNEFLWKVPSNEIVSNGTLAASTQTTFTALVPTGIKVNALIGALINSATANTQAYIASPDITPAYGVNDVATVGVANDYGSGTANVRTNTSGQFNFAASNALSALFLGTQGWIDTFGITTSTVSFRSVINNLVQFPGGVSGLTIANDAVNAANGIRIAPGLAADTTNAVMMQNTASFLKNINGAWVAGGNGNTGLDTGTVANNNWYHLFIISSADGTLVDFLFSLSPTAPTLPTGYPLFRRIGSVRYYSSAIRPFQQFGNRFIWSDAAPIQDYSSLALAATTATSVSLAANVPTGISVTALLAGWISSATAGSQFIVRPKNSSNTNPNSTIASAQVANVYAGWNFAVDVVTDATVVFYSNGALTVQGGAYGWIDTLGAPAAGAVVVTQVQPGAVAPGQLYGLTLANDATTPATVLDIAKGVAADSTGVYLMTLATAFTKSTAAFAVGTGAGGLDTGTIANSTWYHVHLIKNLNNNAVDVLLSLSATAPTLPSGYTIFRRIGSIYYVSSAIKPFSQNGHEFLWKVGTTDVSAQAIAATTATMLTMSVPTGIKVNALLGGQLNSASANAFLDIGSPDITVGSTYQGSCTITAPVANSFFGFTTNVRTNTLGQVQAFASSAVNLYLGTAGWIDTRGTLAP